MLGPICVLCMGLPRALCSCVGRVCALMCCLRFHVFCTHGRFLVFVHGLCMCGSCVLSSCVCLVPLFTVLCHRASFIAR
jgi:hypothetical protein